MSSAPLDDWPLAATHRGWPRRVANAEGWRGMGASLHSGEVALLGLWGDRGAVHAAFYQRQIAQAALLSVAVDQGRAPSLAALHAPALRPERAIEDLFGIEMLGMPDRRPWLDHGRWAQSAPLAAQPGGGRAAHPVEFLAAQGPSLHQIPVGPVHAGIIEPGHFRFSAHGETVVRLEARLGYAHKGIEKLMQGKTAADAAPLAARVSGDSTVAYAWAFGRAVECALDVTPPARAVWLRAIMAELERIANHLGDFGAICNDASFSLMHAECGILREHTLRVAALCFGHRLMMDRIVPGGIAGDIAPAGAEALRDFLARLGRKLPELEELYDNTASLQDRTVGTGILRADLAAEYACGGYVGRASGRDFDTRRALTYAPYDVLRFEVPVLIEGDVDARVRVRIAEIRASMSLLEQLLQSLPPGPTWVLPAAPTTMTEGTAMVEGFRGDILVYVRIGSHGRIERCHLRDPSWFQWPLLEAVIEGNIVADFPLCNKSFNCSYSGHDL
jgi:Ni,Fe-hydrogenase III large subunit